MKTFAKLTLIAALSAATLTATAASAQPRADWMPIAQRQAELQHRIDAGVRRGDLTRHEAHRLQGRFNQIAQLETRYSANGLNRGERADLERRYDNLSSHIRMERHDGQRG